MKIIQSRLEGVPGNIVDPDAIQFAGRKVAAVSGDARRVLDICRRAVEIAESESGERELSAMSPTKQGRLEASQGRVMIATIKQAINEATSSALQQCLKALPLASKLFLAALLTRIRRSGISECVLGDLMAEAGRLSQIADEPALRRQWWIEASTSVGHHTLGSQYFALGEAAADLMEHGIVAVEPRKGERTGKVRLSVSEEEIKLAFRDDGEVRGLGLL